MTHGPLTESSLSHSLRTHIWKGREGKGIGREGKDQWLRQVSIATSSTCASAHRLTIGIEAR